MSRRALWRRLLWIGFTAGKRSVGERIRSVALVAAAATLTMVFMSCLAVIATYDGWDQRDKARAVELARGARAPIVALYKIARDSVGTTPHDVVYVEPRASSVAPPPGLSRWPRPGEAFLSPELLRAGAGEAIRERYGKFAGLIQADGLATPSERLAYVRPVVADHHGWFRVTRFGSERFTPMGDTLNRVPAGQLLATIGLTIGGAAVVLLVIAARCGSAARDRRTHLLTVLGADRRHLALLHLGEALVPSAVGAVAGSIPYLVMSLRDVRVPLIDQVVASGDLWAWVWVAPACALAACVLAVSVVVGLHRVGADGKGTRPRVFADAVPRWRLYAGVLGLVAIVSTPYLPGMASFFAYIGGTALLWGMLPSAAGVVIRRWGRTAAAFGAWSGRGDALVAGRWASARPGVVVRLVAVVVIGLGVITQAQVWSSRLGPSAQGAQALQKRLLDAVLVVTPQTMTSAAVREFQGFLPGSATTMLVTSPDRPADVSVLHGSCAAIRSLGMACPAVSPRLADGDLRAAALGQFISRGGDVDVREASVFTGVTTADAIAVISPPGSANLSGRVKQAAYRAFGEVRVDRPYDNGPLGADRLTHMADWVALLTVLMLAVLSLAVAFSSASEFLAFTTSVAPLAVLSERRRFLAGIAVWNLTLPTVIAVAFGVAVAAWQGTFYTAMTQAGVFSWSLLAKCAAGALVLAIVIGLAGGLGAMRAAARWRPAAD